MREMSKKVIGITGNIASGKTAVTDYLIKKGYEVIDTDKITQDVYDDNDYFKQEIIKLFGNDVVTNNIIEKKLISKLVFNDNKKREELNRLIHPIIREETKQRIEQLTGLFFVDVPLMYEVNFDSLVDEVIMITIDKNIQIDRLMKRNKLSKEDALKRIESQMPQEEKVKKAEYIINNDGSLDDLYKQINKILEKLEGK